MIGIIPAAGKGTRLKPITDAIPKELLICGSKPLIEHALDSMNAIGISRVCIVTGHKKGPLMDFIKDGALYNIDVDYVYQTHALGLGHAILCTKNKIHDGEKDLFVLNGDTVIEPKSVLTEMAKTHKKEKPIATLLIHEVADPKRWGIAKLDGFNGNIAEVKKLFEKPQNENEWKEFAQNGKYYAIVGVYCLNQKMYDYLEKTKAGRGGEIQLTDAIELAIKNKEKVIAMKFDGSWLDIGAPKTFLMAQWEYFKNKKEDDILALAAEWDAHASKAGRME
ncbi:MAG: nucleotidyltransferase family protein [Nanoarchaeota archaeon]|nr:nucleotidyltransferase family protein [Nanoarchaeota archaeon]MBU4301061.1 nucleotidyltransferase family protein [Nanoarchaeota archaeon]MBU4451393.1 nucleotidyltransferase family protein [Nanoarchaeota archaeon]MCG2724053.1 nucleotidyltransferase family protein [archaeon]